MSNAFNLKEFFSRIRANQKNKKKKTKLINPLKLIFKNIKKKKKIKNKKQEVHLDKKKKDQNLLNVDRKYELIKWKHKGKLVPLSYSRVKYSHEDESLTYKLIEPTLNKKLIDIINTTISYFEDRVDIPLDRLKARNQVYSYLLEKMHECWRLYDFNLSEVEKLKVQYYVFRETSGLGKIEALMHDPNIEDISCDGINLPVYIFHRDPRFGEMPTSIIFKDKKNLDNYVLKLAQKCGRSLSVSNPLMDGSLRDGSRVQVTYGTEIARRGSNFTIRKFTKKPLSPVDLMNYNTVNSDVLAYLWFLIEKQKSILISGSTAVGKTSFLNALSLFIDPNMKVVSIEDTSELRLPHPNWIPEVSRIGFGPHHYGEVTMYDLLKSSLRQRPDYLVVGEVRGEEASVMFHAMSTGHPAFSTIHADRMETVIDRLTTRPIDLPKSLLETLDTIVFLIKSKRQGKFIRRLNEIYEIVNYDIQNKKINSNKYANWNAGRDNFSIHESKILQRLPKELGISEEKIKESIAHKKKILDWMQKRKISDYRDVAKIIQLYYSEPKEVYKLIEEKNEE